MLEGGGALGLAHIGVIRWLEENHIPVHYVAGTSMGALVGGLYAGGYDAAELQNIVAAINWDEVMSDQIQYQDLAYRRKEDFHDYPNSLELGLQSGLTLPSGFNSGFQVSLILDRYMLPYSQLKSFNELPIPFRCVAVDLVSRKKYVFDRGPVSMAMRASMSLPAFFSPVEDKQHIYVDGGLLDNLPVDVAREMGAERTLAVHLETKRLSPDAALSSFGVLEESVSVVIAANEQESIKKADTLVQVDVSDFTSTDYDAAQQLITRGYKSAQKNAAILKQYSVDDATWNQYIKERNARRIQTNAAPQFVAVEGASAEQAKSIQYDLRKWIGKPVDFSTLNDDLTEIVGTGRFSTLDYDLTTREQKTGLLVTATERHAPILINPLIVIDGSQIQNVRFALGARFTKYGAGSNESEWRTDFALGSEYGIATDYFRPFKSVPGWFIDPGMIANTSPFDIYYQNNDIAGYRLQKISGYFDGGYLFSRDSELRLGYQVGYLKLAEQIGNPIYGSPGNRLGQSSIAYRFTGVDDPIVPHHGSTIDSHFSWFDSYLGSTSPFPSAELRLAHYQPIGNTNTVFATLSGGSDFGYSRSGLPSFSLGGPTRLAAFGRNELLTNQYGLVQIGYMQQIFKFPALVGKGLYVYGAGEGGRVYNVNNESPWPADGVVGIVLQTAFGPVIVGGSYGTTGHQKFFFQVGKVF